MANVIRHKRGTSTPSTSDFSNTAEILVDTSTGNIFNKTDGNSVVKVNGLSNIVEDTTPQLGGDLDMNSKFISSGILAIKNTGSQSQVRLYCESNNAHYVAVQAPAHADFSGNPVLTLPSTNGQEIVGTAESQTITNKTIDVDNNTISNIEVDNFKSGVLDTNLSAVSSSDDTLASAKAIKTYVDTEVAGAGGGGVTVEDEGSALSTTATTLNFVGSGVQATGTGATKTITVSGGSTDLIEVMMFT
tara:strand:+ start:130 stop:867 length:738 start_codon:yes stop_codon:yes gene_type:complete